MTDKRLLRDIHGIFEKLAGEGDGLVRPGQIADVLRAENRPMGTWQVRGLLSELAAEGSIAVDTETGAWQLSRTATTQSA